MTDNKTFKKKPVIGNLSAVRKFRKGKDGKEYDLIVGDMLEPSTGRKFKFTAILGYEAAKHKHTFKDKETGNLVSVVKNHTRLQFDGIKDVGAVDGDLYDYTFVPVKTLDDEESVAPVKKAVSKKSTINEDLDF